MTRSFSFDGISLRTYLLLVRSLDINQVKQGEGYVQLKDKGYPFTPTRGTRTISVDFIVTALNRANLDNNLDNIKRILATLETKQLIFESLNDRYFNARLVSFDGSYHAPTLFVGTVDFVCPDPLGYDIDEQSSDFSINADPKTVQETTGGTGYINPVYTLTAGEALSSVTILVENIDTGEELSWGGSLAITEQLEIDVANWIVKKEGVASMSDVSGQFPRLLPDATNNIKITGFSNTGNLNITYRNTYL